MEFLNGVLLGGVALGGIPVVIHLLNRRRYRETIWAAMEFLRAAVKRNATRLRLEDLLLLALRVLVVVVLAVAMARPTLTGRWIGWMGLDRKSSTAVVIVLDNSYSMGAVDGRATLFDRAREAARQIVRSLPRAAGSSAAVILVNDRVEPLVGRLSHDLEAVDQALTRARISDGATDFLQALTQVRDVILPEARTARTEVHLLTDGQRGAFLGAGSSAAKQSHPALEALLADLARKADVFIDVIAPADTENVAATDLRIPDLASAERTTHDVLPSVHAATAFTATVRNFGRAPRDYLPVDLVVDGRVVDRQVLPRIDPGGEKRVTFRWVSKTAGSHRVAAEVVPGPGDRVGSDNVRNLSLYVYDQVRVLAVDGEPNPEPFESETDYVRLALSPVDLDAPEATFLITTDVATLDELEGVRLADYRVIVLANVGGVSRSLAGRLARFVTDGGGLIVFLGDRVDARDYNDVLYADGRGLLPARLGSLVGDPRDTARAFGLSSTGLSHYLVNHYAPTDLTLSRVKVYAAIGAEAPVEKAEVVLRYTNGQPALITRPLGLGHVILVTTSADAEWTNLPTTNALVPLMQRAVNYLVFGQHAPERLNLLRGTPFLLQLRPEEAPLQVTITDPDGSPRAFPGRAGRDRIEWTETWRSGFYRVELADTPPRLDFFAVNLNTVESDLSLIEETRLSQLAPAATVAWIRDSGEQLTASLRRRRTGTELWPYLLAGVLLLLVGEGLLARAISLRGAGEIAEGRRHA